MTEDRAQRPAVLPGPPCLPGGNLPLPSVPPRLGISRALACLAILTSALTAPSAAEVPITDGFHHRRWTRTDGLPDTRIHFLAQSGDGYLWIATRAGLVRFDGSTFVTFTRANTGLLDVDDIRHGIVDPAGTFHVVASYSNWVRWNGSGLVPGQIPDHETRHGWQVPIPVPGERRWLIRSDIVPHLHTSRWESAIQILHSIPEGSFLFESQTGKLHIVENGRWSERDPANNQTRTNDLPRFTDRWGVAMAESSEGEVWLRYGDAKASVLRLYQITGAGPVPIGEGREGNEGRPEFLVMSRGGDLWQPAGAKGLDRFAGGQFTRFTIPWGREVDRAQCMIEDREGNFWIGTEEFGLHQLIPRRFHAVTEADGLPNPEVRTITAGADRVWLGTDAGLAWIGTSPLGDSDAMAGSRQWLSQAQSIEGPFAPHSNKPLSVRALAYDGIGQLWVGSDRGLFRVEGNRCVPEPVPLRPSPFDLDSLQTLKTRSMVADRAGGLWIATAGYLMHRPVEPSGVQDFTVLKVQAPGPHSLLCDRLGWVWVACPGIGIGCFEPSRLLDALRRRSPDSSSEAKALDAAPQVHWLTSNHGLSSSHAWHLHEDIDGAIWVAAENGLNRISPTAVAAARAESSTGNTNIAAGVFVLTAAHGLPTPQIECVIDDVDALWLGTAQGIARIRRRDVDAILAGVTNRLSVELFGESEGLPSTEVNGRLSHPSVCRAPDGRLGFATSKGAAWVDPRRVQDSHAPPLVAVEQVRADDQLLFSTLPERLAGANGPSSLLPDSGSRDSQERTPPRLAPGRARVMEFGFTALHFADPDSCRFRFRLDGYHRPGTWHEAGDRRRAFFTNLDPGTYEFQVQAASRLSDWSAVPAVYRFSLGAHYWQTWPFRIALGLGVTGVAVALVSWRVRELRRLDQLRHEKTVLSERLDLARDLHDIVGAQFTELIQLGELAGRLPAEQAVPQQRRMAELARELFQSVRHSMWATTPDADNLPALVDYLETAARRLTTPAGLALRLDLPTPIPSTPLSPVARRHLFLAAREAVNNAVKHAHATRITVRLSLEPSGFNLDIEDDGCGLPAGLGDEPTEHGDPRHIPGGTLGQGLKNIRQRLHEAGGSAAFLRPTAGGLCVRLRMPRRG
jgi:signal transduction histidine kinase/ligand-binding sensor domain-containing protein